MAIGRAGGGQTVLNHCHHHHRSTPLKNRRVNLINCLFTEESLHQKYTHKQIHTLTFISFNGNVLQGNLLFVCVCLLSNGCLSLRSVWKIPLPQPSFTWQYSTQAWYSTRNRKQSQIKLDLNYIYHSIVYVVPLSVWRFLSHFMRGFKRKTTL